MSQFSSYIFALPIPLGKEPSHFQRLAGVSISKDLHSPENHPAVGTARIPVQGFPVMLSRGGYPHEYPVASALVDAGLHTNAIALCSSGFMVQKVLPASGCPAFAQGRL